MDHTDKGREGGRDREGEREGGRERGRERGREGEKEGAHEQRLSEWKAEMDGVESELDNCKKREAR